MISIKLSGMELMCEADGHTLAVKEAKGDSVNLTIPEAVTVDDKKFTIDKIEKKAFLGKKNLKELHIEAPVSFVGDWAFSQCTHLKRLYFDNSDENLTFGRAVFEGCERMQAIKIGKMEQGISYLLGSCANRFNGGFLLKDSDIGSEGWCHRYDLALLNFLSQSDFEGYSDRALCGEEDISYDEIGSIDGEMSGEDMSYIMSVAKNKCYLCFLRLMNDDYLKNETRDKLVVYISNRAFGEKNPAAWLSLKEFFFDKLEYFKLYMDLIKPDRDLVNAMIKDLGEELFEARAFLIEAEAPSGNDAFFDDMML